MIVQTEQPQTEIIARVEALAATRLRTAEDRIQEARRRFQVADQPVRQAEDELKAVQLEVRQSAFAEIRAAIQTSQDALEARLIALGAQRIRRFQAISMIAAAIPASAINILEADPAVAEVIPDESRQVRLTISAPSLGATTFWSHGKTGIGQYVAVLDTGIASDHPAFSGTIVTNHISLDAGRVDSCFGDDSGSAYDLVGHGTHVAGIVASAGSSECTTCQGVAKGLSGLLNLKVAYKNTCKNTGSSQDSDVLAALNWAIQNAPYVSVFNYSSGLSPTTGAFPQSETDDSLARQFDRLADNYQLSIVVSAGNDGTTAACGSTGCVNSPGTAYNVISVASMDDNNTLDRADDSVSSFSSRGPVHRPLVPGGQAQDRNKPDLAAPGATTSGSSVLGIFSTAYWWNQYHPFTVGCPVLGSCPDFIRDAGTSMAAPHISGALALLREVGVTNPLAAKALLLNTTDTTGWASDRGWGYANLNRAYGQTNTFTGSAGPSQARYYRGNISGGFWSTLTWNRHFDAVSSPYLNDLDLLLYSRPDGGLLSSSTSTGQNVEQVSSPVSSGAVLKVKVATPSFPSGLSAESFGVALSQSGFVSATGPVLSVGCTSPGTVGSAQVFSVTCTTQNLGDLEAFTTQVTLTPPPSFTGGSAKVLGTISPAGSSAATWLLTAPSVSGTSTVNIAVASRSFGETFNASTSVNVSVGSAPAAPTVTTSPASSVSGNTATLAATVNPNGTSTLYWFQYGTNISLSGSATTPSFGLGAGTAPLQVTANLSSLNGNTVYYYRAVASNAGGVTNGGILTFTTAASTPPSESISVPGTPSGPAIGSTSTAYNFYASGATSSLGHPLQYQFTFGNGDVSPWIAPGAPASDAWFSAGTYAVKVQARCSVDNQIVSSVSAPLTVTITAPVETLTTPNTPGGPNQVTTSAGYRYYWQGGAVSSLGHSVQYQFVWGDGTTSGWLPVGTEFADKVWSSSGSKNVILQARCSLHTSVTSPDSPAFAVTATTPGGSLTLLAGNLNNPTGLAVDSANVYWTDTGSGRVLKISSAGSGSGPITLAGGVTNPAGIALDDTYLYFSEGGSGNTTIRRVPKAGGTITILASSLASVARIAVDASNIYWTDPAGGAIRSMPKAGGSYSLLASDSNSPTGIAVDASNVYWTQMVKPGNLMSVPLNGGTVQAIGYETNTPGVASDGTYVYWTQYAYTAGEIRASYKGKGGVTSVLAGNLNSPNDLAADGSSVYWVEMYPGNVKQVSVAGGAAITLASGLAEPIAIAQDSSSVYWLENNYGAVSGGVLRKAPKQSPSPLIRVTVQTSINGIAYYVDGNYYQNSPQVFYWTPGSSHTLQATQSQYCPGGAGRCVFGNWSDGGDMSHSVAPSVDTTYTATQFTQYSLALVSNGNGTPNATATGYMNAGSVVSLAATPNAGYTFVGWSGSGSGSYSGPLTNASVTMNGMIIEAALFNQCTYGIGTGAQSFTAAGGTGSVPVTVLPGCAWQAVSNVPWITISSGSGSGNGTVAYSVGANTTGSPQTGSFTVGGQTFTVSQTADAVCSYVLAPSSATFSRAGGTGTISVVATNGCPWSAAVANADWVTIQTGGSGSANGNVGYSVQPNATGNTRVAAIGFAGSQYLVVQSGLAGDGQFTFAPFRDANAVTGPYKLGVGTDGKIFLATLVSSGANGLQLTWSTDHGATFGTPVPIASNRVINGSTSSFDMVVDSVNNVHIAWWGNGGTDSSDVFYARSTDGGASFGPPKIVRTGTALNGYTTSSASDPRVASDGLGNVYVAYPTTAKDQNGAIVSAAWVSRSTDGGVTFQPEFFMNTPDSNSYGVASLLAQSGSFFALVRDMTNHDTYFHRGDSSSTSAGLTRINQTPHQAAYQSSLAADASGSVFYAIYNETASSPADIFFTKSTDGGATWGNYVRVNDVSTNERFNPALVLDPNGGLNVAWVDHRSNQSYQIYYAYSGDQGTTFSANNNMVADQPATGFNLPQLISDPVHSLMFVGADKDSGQVAISPSVPPAILTISKSHSGSFTQGQSGATYSISVSNKGLAPTSGPVTVTDTLPVGLTATAIAGTGWTTCTLASLTCSRSDTLAAGDSFAAITVTVNVAAGAASQVTNQASVSGGGASTATTNDVTTINATLAAQTITFGPLSNVTFGVSPFAISATASSGLTVSLASTTSPVCTISGSTVTIVSVGTCSMTATQPGNSNYAAAAPVSQTFLVLIANQTISFSTLSNAPFGSGPITLTATASSNLPVSYASTTTPVCTVSGNTLTLVSTGTCAITASQTGSATYGPAPPITQSFTITQASQTISFPQPAALPVGSGPTALAATTSSGLLVSFASTTPTVCTVSGGSVTPVAAGSCGITASQAGNLYYAAATPVTRTFLVVASDGVSLNAGTGSGSTGQTVEIPITMSLTGSAAPAAFQVDLSFDTAKLSFISARAGAQATAAGKGVSSATPVAGTARLLVTGFNQNVIGSGLVAYASFKLTSGFTSGSSTLNAGNCSSSDINGAPVLTSCTAGVIKYASCDINGDGNTTVTDVQLIINEALGVAPATHDLNGDGAVTVGDVQLVINAALGLGCNVR